jgi:hypothetical protein
MDISCSSASTAPIRSGSDLMSTGAEARCDVTGLTRLSYVFCMGNPCRSGLASLPGSATNRCVRGQRTVDGANPLDRELGHYCLLAECVLSASDLSFNPSFGVLGQMTVRGA